MDFDSCATRHATYLSGHALGESIEYRAWPGTTWQTFSAMVDRQPVDEVGQFLRNALMVRVSKDFVAEVVITKDEVRLTKDKRTHQEVPSYVVKSASEFPGYWLLHCERKK